VATKGIGSMKAMFHWTRKNDILESIPNIDAVSKGKVVYQERFTFDSEQIDRILSAANATMQAMIWLGVELWIWVYGLRAAGMEGPGSGPGQSRACQEEDRRAEESAAVARNR
jgi:hypothetical protein